MNKKNNRNSIESEASRSYKFLFAEPKNEPVFDGFTNEEARKKLDVVPTYRSMHTKIGKFFQRLVLSVSINRRFRMPFRNLFITIDNYDYKDDIDYYMIIPSMSLIRWEADEIAKFKAKHKNVSLILLILDSLHAGSYHLPYVKDKIFSDLWDLVITYDRNDAEEYGFTWLGYTYYPQCSELPKIEGGSDALYIGFNKRNRNERIGELYKYLNEHGVECDFRIVSIKKETDEIVPGLCITNQRYTYPEIAAMANNTNCIIEMLMEGQKAQSYRYFEAITYNKKLLTNNPNVKTLPYYDDRYMKFFDSVNEIDTEWVKAKENIDYGYQGEFAQIKLLDFLKKELSIQE